MSVASRLGLSLLVFFLAAPTFAVSFPTPYVTRAESVMILLQSRMGAVPNVKLDRSFPDVTTGQWYERYLALGDKYKIIESDPVTNRMRPDAPVTRAEFLKMASRTFALPENLPYLYVDVPAGSWYASFAGIAQVLWLFPGDRDQHVLQPNQVMTHDEVVRALQIIIQKKQQLTPDFRHTPLTISDHASLPAPSLPSTARTSTEQTQVTLIKPKGSTPNLEPVLVLGSPTSSSNDNSVTLSALRDGVMRLVNQERLRRGLSPVEHNVSLEESAQKYAERMANEGFFSHVAPNGETFRDRVEHSGYERPFYQQDCLCTGHYTLAENIARGQKTPVEVMHDWMNSPEHRAVILTPSFTDIGIGIRAGIWVEHFGSKLRIEIARK